MANTGMTAIGVTGLGAGILLIYSAFTKKPLFGADGLLRQFIATGSVEQAGKAAGKAASDLAKNYGGIGKTIGEGVSGLGATLGAVAANLKPPGAK